MRFIEALFGLSPDNNSGATEAVIFLAIFAGVMAIGQAARRARGRRRGAPS
jgi:hypothetical protein